jgi:hypothetical protein
MSFILLVERKRIVSFVAEANGEMSLIWLLDKYSSTRFVNIPSDEMVFI